MDNRQLLKDSLEKMGISLSENQTQQFFDYKSLLVEWNEKMNLTAITDEREVIIKHFVDSISILSEVKIEEGAEIIDVGTGAGFPGLPVKIIRPDLKVTLLDSLNKRIGFLDQVCTQLGLENVDNIHSRAEDGGQSPMLREKFDYCLSRAVANLAVLSEYCLPFVKVGGMFVSLKGPDAVQEIKDAEIAIKKLGGEVERVIKIEIPNSDITHSLIIIKKIDNTPKVYPRKAGTASKKPIK
ncbi:MAG TPA: 16S rRNA (guanine(527)-N(7))-methyltransferase RsmG [Lachnospiraceae bacterium]|nr:16S rRNA (guanine(527)-N(7))-methyltransferase RsmG [Lachnospiraceae bacterium]